MGNVVLILGAARSGKSTYAERLALHLGGPNVLYVATAEAKDDEMSERISRHRAGRPVGWRTLEAPLHVGEQISHSYRGEAVVLVDCLTLLVTNALLALGEEPDPEAVDLSLGAELSDLLVASAEVRATFIIVSNEVGMGLVPPYPLGRIFRDQLGLANQTIADAAKRVFLMVAGMPLDLTALQAPWPPKI